MRVFIPQIGDIITLKYTSRFAVELNSYNKAFLEAMKVDLTNKVPGDKFSVYITVGDMLQVHEYHIDDQKSEVFLSWNGYKFCMNTREFVVIYSKIDSKPTKTIVSIKHPSYYRHQYRGQQKQTEDIDLLYSVNGIKKVEPALFEKRVTRTWKSREDTKAILREVSNYDMSEVNIFWKHAPNLSPSRATVITYILKKEGLKRENCLLRVG